MIEMGSKIKLKNLDMVPILSYGFRPFFLLAAIWAFIAMLIWIGMLSSVISLPTYFDTVSWHAHEFLFGYMYAVIAGFLLTAVPSWTSREPLNGFPLLCLVLLWVAGRLVVACSGYLPREVVYLTVLSMPIILCVFIGSEIIRSKNWKNLIVIGAVGSVIIGNFIFLTEVYAGGYAAKGFGLRIGLGSIIMMIAIIGGRIIPAFTRNYLNKVGEVNLPTQFGKFDLLTLLILLFAMIAWITEPENPLTATSLILAGLLHFLRLSRWCGIKTTDEPLVWVLHIAYALLPTGAVAIGLAILMPDLFLNTGTMQHIWMLLCVGLMTLAVMTRASLGHAGRQLTANLGTTLIYLSLLLSGIARITASFSSDMHFQFLTTAGSFWLIAFGGFILAYGPLLVRKRLAS